jgi:hypothetical protein
MAPPPARRRSACGTARPERSRADREQAKSAGGRPRCGGRWRRRAAAATELASPSVAHQYSPVRPLTRAAARGRRRTSRSLRAVLSTLAGAEEHRMVATTSPPRSAARRSARWSRADQALAAVDGPVLELASRPAAASAPGPARFPTVRPSCGSDASAHLDVERRRAARRRQGRAGRSRRGSCSAPARRRRLPSSAVSSAAPG